MKGIIRYASLLMAAVMLFSCNGDDNGGSTGNKTLTITSDKNLIQTFGGDYATLTVKLGGEVVTEDVMFFDAKNNILDIVDFKFATDKAGKHEIWASYGTYNSEPISIMAISVEIPATPADPQPSSTAFKARTLITEFTTVGCTACPGMKNLLHKVLNDEEHKEFADQLVMMECHSGLVNSVADQCFIATGYDEFCGIQGYPTVNIDMFSTFSNYKLAPSDFRAQVNTIFDYKKDLAAGIAVNSSLVDGQVIAKVTVKSAAKGNYRVGAFLVEDGVYGKQLGGEAQDWMDTHDGVVRHIDALYYSGGGERYYGFSIGEIAKGATADYVFVWDLDAIWAEGSDKAQIQGGGKPWAERVDENLHMVVFVTTVGEDEKGNQFYYVNNVIDCPLDGQTPYEYK